MKASKLTKRQWVNICKLFKGGKTMWELGVKYRIPIYEVEDIVRQVLCQQEAQ